jgi:hypothetical protein
LGGGGKMQILHRQRGRLLLLIKTYKYKSMYKKSISMMLLLVMGIFLSPPADAQTGESGYSFSVEKTGHGPALILIPGLYYLAGVWRSAADACREGGGDYGGWCDWDEWCDWDGWCDWDECGGCGWG